MVDYQPTLEDLFRWVRIWLTEAGFKLDTVSQEGSEYYHMTGRKGGQLRLSGHRNSQPATSKLTIVEPLPTLEKLERMTATAIGYYVLRSKPNE